MISAGAVAAMQGVAGVAAGLPARYIRVFPLVRGFDTSSSVSFAEIYFAESPGGVNIALGKTLTASADSASAPNLIDGNHDTSWSVVNRDYMDQWVKIDFGAVVSPVEFGVRSSGLNQRCPHVFAIQGSLDDVTWNSIAIIELGSTMFGVKELRTAALAQQTMENVETNARCWEVQYTAHTGSEVYTRDIQFIPTANGAARTGDGPFGYSNSNHPSYTSAGITDGNVNTLHAASWGGGAIPPVGPVRLGFARAAVVGVIEQASINCEGGTQPTAVAWRWSVDGVNWNTKKSFSGVSLLNGTAVVFDLRTQAEGAATPASHRYWRLVSLSSNGFVIHVTEVEMAATAGGADLCTGGTAISSATAASFPAGNAFDGSNITYYQPTGNANTGGDGIMSGSWVGYDFGSPVTIREVRLTRPSADLQRQVRVATLQGSDDNVTWHSYDILRVTDWRAQSPAAFEVNSRGTLPTDEFPFWCINVTKTQLGQIQLGELVFANTVSGPSIVTGLPPIFGPMGASSESFAAVNFLRGDGASSKYAHNTFTTNNWPNGRLGVCFETGQAPGELRLQTSSDFPTGAPENFTIERSHDGVTWEVMRTVTGQTGWTASQIRTWTIP